MRQFNICLIGFGNVGRAFAELLESKEKELTERDLQFRITAVVTGSHGRAINAQGWDFNQLSQAYDSNSLSSLSTTDAGGLGTSEIIRASKADILVETSPVDYETGQPAISHIRTALEAGMHAVSANKGPVVHAYHELQLLAAENNKRFLFESTVMDGAPIFSVFREALPAANILGFTGILNSCTNILLEKMEAGDSFEDAVAYAQSIGIAETDPSGDIDGWDAAIKVAALVTVMMNKPFKPQMVERVGIRAVDQKAIQDAKNLGKRWKLVCTVEIEGGKVKARVQPEMVPPSSPLYAVNGTSSVVIFKTDVLPGLGILESDPGPRTTAYGLLADILNILKAER